MSTDGRGDGVADLIIFAEALGQFSGPLNVEEFRSPLETEIGYKLLGIIAEPAKDMPVQGQWHLIFSNELYHRSRLLGPSS